MRRRIRFEGRVQGVGFRATTRHIVRSCGLPLSGWVRNEPDGSVALVLEGEAADIERALGELRATMGRLIEREREEGADADEALSGFEVRR